MGFSKQRTYRLAAMLLLAIGGLGLAGAIVLGVMHLVQREANEFRNTELVANQAGPGSAMAIGAYE